MMPARSYYSRIEVAPNAYAITNDRGRALALVIEGPRPGQRTTIPASQLDSYAQACSDMPELADMRPLIAEFRRVTNRTTQ